MTNSSPEADPSDCPRRVARTPQSGSLRIRIASGLLAGVLALTLVTACNKPPPTPPPTPTPEPTPPPTPRPKPTPKPTPTPTPSPMPTPVPTPTPVVHRYAPPGVFYVLEDVTVRLSGGLLGVTAGTEVKMLVDNGEVMRMTDGRDQFDLKKSQVTNDLDIAASTLKRAGAAAAASDQFRAQQDSLLQKQQQAELDYLRTHPLATATPTPSATPRR